MHPPLRHVLQQGPNLAALIRTARSASAKPDPSAEIPATPRPWVEAEVPALPPGLVRDYIEHVGGRPEAWGDALPTHLFPQWSFRLLGDTLQGLPFPMRRALNAGCTLTSHRPLPQGEPLLLKARLASIEDDERKTLLTQEIVTGTASAPEALTAEMRVIIPKKRKDGEKKKKAAPHTVPPGSEEVRWFELDGRAGLDFAILTGDFNPIHWIPAAGRAAGFGGCVLHGFGTMARALEGLVQARCDGDVHRLHSTDIRFTAPVKLPGAVGLFVHDSEFHVGAALGAPAALVGTFSLREDSP